MKPVILITHGDLAAAFLHSAALVLGELPQDVHAVCLSCEDSLESARAKIDAVLENLLLEQGNRETLLLVDLYGGTAANAAAWASQTHKVEVVAGVNLPMLLEVLLNREELSIGELARLAIEKGREGIVDLIAALREFQA